MFLAEQSMQRLLFQPSTFVNRANSDSKLKRRSTGSFFGAILVPYKNSGYSPVISFVGTVTTLRGHLSSRWKWSSIRGKVQTESSLISHRQNINIVVCLYKNIWNVWQHFVQHLWSSYKPFINSITFIWQTLPITASKFNINNSYILSIIRSVTCPNKQPKMFIIFFIYDYSATCKAFYKQCINIIFFTVWRHMYKQVNNFSAK